MDVREAGSSLTPLMTAARAGHVEVVRRLLARGAAVNAAADGHGTALAVAAANNRVEVVRALLAAGADPNAGTPTGHTPLMFAARNADDGVAALELLLCPGQGPTPATTAATPRVDVRHRQWQRPHRPPAPRSRRLVEPSPVGHLIARPRSVAPDAPGGQAHPRTEQTKHTIASVAAAARTWFHLVQRVTYAPHCSAASASAGTSFASRSFSGTLHATVTRNVPSK